VRLKKLCRQAGRYWATIRPALLFVAEEERRLRQRRGHFIAWRGIMSLRWIPTWILLVNPLSPSVGQRAFEKKLRLQSSWLSLISMRHPNYR
jgi:hypothetical protein